MSRVLLAAALGCGALVCGCDASEPPAPAAAGADNPVDPRSLEGADTTSTTEALKTATSRSPRTIAAMMFDIGSGPPNAANIMSVIGGTGQSQRHMYQEISFGIQDTAPQYFGPYTLPVHNCLTIACCGPSSDQTGNGATVQTEINALPQTFNHYFWVYGTIPSGANCGTWGDEGAPSKYATYSSYSFHQIVGYAQEIGHNFGMTHEPIMCCGGTVSGNRCNGGTATMLDDTTQCTHIEYGNALSFMGNGAHHPSAFHKYEQGWIGGCNVVKVGASATFTLVPQELPCDGVQLLQVPAPKSRPAPAAGDRQGTGPTLTDYYLEMRAPVGFDTGVGPMVLVSIGPDFTPTNRAAPYVYVLNMTPATASLASAGLTAGKSFTDPGGGLTFTVDSIDANSASVTVTMSGGSGANTCVDSTPFTAPGPDASSCGPLAGGSGGAGGATGGSSGSGGSTGSGGSGGATGSGGAGGRPGTGGKGGATGTGGTSGSGGTTGTGGTIGTGGATGAGGTVGTGGATGTAGSTGLGGGPGSGGSPSGTGGAPGSGNAGSSGTGASASSGCSCDAGGGGRPRTSWLLAIGLAAFIARRRSRRDGSAERA
ncbi:MAG TPA: hypothetical protein VKZ18_10185 [Polyangia bacterium]|nr:hypothetical protein [Polyangia bacterium]